MNRRQVSLHATAITAALHRLPALARRLVAREIGDYCRQKRCVRKDGAIVWVAVTVSLARKPDGHPDYFISVTEDITERKQGEEHAKLLTREINHRAKNLLAAVMTWSEHEGPTPKPPQRHGFGHTVTVQMAEHALEGRVQLDYRQSGLVWKLRAPAERVIGRNLSASRRDLRF